MLPSCCDVAFECGIELSYGFLGCHVANTCARVAAASKEAEDWCDHHIRVRVLVRIPPPEPFNPCPRPDANLYNFLNSVCIISILRIPSLLKASRSTDPTFDNCGIAIWSIVEVNAAIVGACLPTLKPLIGRVFPNLLSSVHTESPSYYQHSRGSNRTATNTHGGDTGTQVAAGTTPDYSSATNVLVDEDDVPLRKMEGKVASVHVEGTDDTRSEVTTGRSIDGWCKAEDEV